MTQTLTEKLLGRLPEGWQNQILNLYSAGCSDYEVMFEMKLHYRLFRQLMADPEFAEVIEFGRQASRAWWERQGRVNLENKDFNAGLWRINVQARLGWSEKYSVHGSEDSFEKALNNDELEQQITEKIAKLKVVNKEEIK